MEPMEITGNCYISLNTPSAVLELREQSEGPLIEVYHRYHTVSDADKLLCLQNVQSWIDGERKRINAAPKGENDE